MMLLNGFVQGNTDEELLKSLPTENVSEDLVKAMNKAGLVQKEIQVKGKNGQMFTRKQWVKASDVKDDTTATKQNPANDSTKAAATKFSVGEQVGLKLPGGTVESWKVKSVDTSDSEVKYTVVSNNLSSTSKSKVVSEKQLVSVNSKPQSASQKSNNKYKPSDFQFKAGGEKTASLMNNLDRVFGVDSFSNGAPGHGIAKLKNGESVNFGMTSDGVSVNVTYQGYVYNGDPKQIAEDLYAKMYNKPYESKDDVKVHPQTDHTTTTSKPEKKTMLQDYLSGNHGQSSGKDALKSLLGSGYSKDDIMKEAEAQGITWKKNDHEGINWMRASMAIQKYLENPTKKTDSQNQKPDTSSASVSSQPAKKVDDKATPTSTGNNTRDNMGNLIYNGKKISKTRKRGQTYYAVEGESELFSYEKDAKAFIDKKAASSTPAPAAPAKNVNLEIYDDYNHRRYSKPWVAIVNSQGKPDFNQKVGAYSGKDGEAGELYVYEPKEGQVYMHGRKDYRGSNTKSEYVVYEAGKFKPISKTELTKYLK